MFFKKCSTARLNVLLGSNGGFFVVVLFLQEMNLNSNFRNIMLEYLFCEAFCVSGLAKGILL